MIQDLPLKRELLSITTPNITQEENLAEASAKISNDSNDDVIDNQDTSPFQSLQRAFSLGNVMITKGIAHYIETRDFDITTLIQHHAGCDWGDIPEQDKKLNNHAVKNMQNDQLYEGLVSNYFIDDNTKILIISEWHEDLATNVTTIMLPAEY